MRLPKQIGCYQRPPVPLDGHPQNQPLWQYGASNHRPEGTLTQDQRPVDSKKVHGLPGTPHNTTWPISKNPSTLATTDQSAWLNKWNQRTTWQDQTLWIQGMLKAESQCHKLHTQPYGWMTSITQMIQSIKYWQYSWKQAKGQPYHARILYRLHKALPLLPNLENMPQVDIQEYLQKHKEQLHQQIGDLDRWQTWLKEWPKHRPKCEALQLKNT